MKATILRLQSSEGQRYQWQMFREAGLWFLTDHDGYTRTLEETWNTSVPKVRLIAENHGLTFRHDFS